MRKLHINNQEYFYSIGKRFVKIKYPDGRSFCIEKTKITGKSDEFGDADYGDYNENRYGNLINENLFIGPGMIKEYIIKKNYA